MELINNYIEYKKFYNYLNIKIDNRHYLYYISLKDYYILNDKDIADLLNIEIEFYIYLAEKNDAIIIDCSDVYFKTKLDINNFIKDLYTHY